MTRLDRVAGPSARLAYGLRCPDEALGHGSSRRARRPVRQTRLQHHAFRRVRSTARAGAVGGLHTGSVDEAGEGGETLRDARIVEIAFALITSAVPVAVLALVLHLIGGRTGLGQWSGWPLASGIAQVAAAAAGAVRVVVVLVRFERRRAR
jgi:hypothetical protein